ncbi:MAG: glycoside hydrolase family 36 protein [Chloroflexota bacterium]|nr:glycoside hydrolase family 36 protein [Chloroflexota bacterium]
MEIETKDLKLSFAPLSGTLSLQTRSNPKASFKARIGASFAAEGKPQSLLGPAWSILETEEPIIREHPTGPIRQITIHLDTTLPGVQVILRCALSISQAMALIQMELQNKSPKTLHVRQLTLLDIRNGDLHFGDKPITAPTFYSNGWQSWSATGAYVLGDKQQTSMLKRLQNPMTVNPGTPQPKQRNTFTGDMFGLVGDRESRIGLVAGFLSQKAHFGSLETVFAPEPSLRIWANGDRTHLKPGCSMTTDWLSLAVTALDDPEPFGPYLQAVTQTHGFRSTDPIPVGWCSWYHFYQDIDQEKINANLDSVIELKPDVPLPLFQIDDGFEANPGDWFEFVPGFPNGLKPIVEKTATADLTPGVWLAPFIVHPKSKLAAEHPEWLLRDENGKLVRAGFVWNSLTLALDLTIPEALDFAREVIRTAVEDWEFTYLKLDFLYTAALKGEYKDPTKTRAEVIRMGLEALREAAGPEITMLACGCPLGSALGLFEVMRISADVSGHWEPHFPPVSPLLRKEPHMPAARNAIHNILTRAPLHRHWWVNDPDCLLVRPDTDLTLAEVQTLTSLIGLTGGSLLLSDDLPALPADRLTMVKALLPVIDQRARVMDLFDTHFPKTLRVDLDGPIGPWRLLAKFNWADSQKDLTFSLANFDLPADEIWWSREFWTGVLGQLGPNTPLTFRDVPAHGGRVLAVRPFNSNQPTYLGSDLHLSQGQEIAAWEIGDGELAFKFKLGRQAAGRVYFYLPWTPAGVWHRDEIHSLEEHGLGVYTLDLEAVDGATFQIRG